MSDEDKCPKCGYDWDAHEFAVPAPYCPENDEEAESSRKSNQSLREMMYKYRKVMK